MLNQIKFNQVRNKFPFYILIFFPASLVAGPFVAELLMNLFSVIFLYQIIKEKNFLFFKKLYVVIFGIFFIYILVNTFISIYSNNIFFKNFFYFRYGLFAIAILYYINNNTNWLIFIFKFLVATLLVVAIDGYVQYFFHFNIFGFEKIRVDRLSGFFKDQLIIGSYLARLFPLMIGIFFYHLNFFNYKEKIIYIFFFVLIFILIILSGERTALFISISFLILFFISIKLNKLKKFIFSIIFFTIILSSFVFIEGIYGRHLKQTFDQINFNFSNKNFFSNFKYYSQIYETSYNGFKNKIFFGQGANTYRYFCSDKKFATFIKKTKLISLNELIKNSNQLDFSQTKIDTRKFKKGQLMFTFKDGGVIKNYIANEDIEIAKYYQGDSVVYYYYYQNGCTTHPHNFILQILAELGLVGLLFYLMFLTSLIFSFFKIIFRHKYGNVNFVNFRICILVGLLAALIPILPNGNFFNNWLNMITFFSIGFYLFALDKKF